MTSGEETRKSTQIDKTEELGKLSIVSLAPLRSAVPRYGTVAGMIHPRHFPRLSKSVHTGSMRVAVGVLHGESGETRRDEKRREKDGIKLRGLIGVAYKRARVRFYVGTK